MSRSSRNTHSRRRATARPRPSTARRLRRLAGLAILLALAAPACGIAALRFIDPPRTSFMLAQQWSGACDSLEFSWIARARLPSHVGWAALAAEDQRFLIHQGFDYDEIQDAVQARMERGSPLRGASTISQQLAKNLLLWSDRSWLRKGFEAYLTVWLELLVSKQRILELYLNVAQFGPCTFGVEAASRRYFGKPASALTEPEAALLMSVLPNPLRRRADRPSPGLERRAVWIQENARMLERLWPRAL